jgi:TonB family protein
MARPSNRVTMLNVPLLEERYGRSLLFSMLMHSGLFLLVVFGAYLLPPRKPIVIGTGLGGGLGGDVYTVGVTDQLSGGAGMTKPSLTPQPPALIQEKPDKEAPSPSAVPLPQTLEPKKAAKNPAKLAAAAKKDAVTKQSNIIPTAPEKGSGGQGGKGGGEGGGFGGGIGVSIGAGTGSKGFGDSWYAQAVERRISSNWIRPPVGLQIEIIYSFYIAGNGQIYDVKQIKSCGNDILDANALRAIQASNPLAPPPPEFQGRPIQFFADFKYPPSP